MSQVSHPVMPDQVRHPENILKDLESLAENLLLRFLHFHHPSLAVVPGMKISKVDFISQYNTNSES